MRMTTDEFCRKHSACTDGRKWALSVSPDMAVVWDAMIEQRKIDWLCWVAGRDGVLTDKQLRLLACQFVRETPLADGRKVYDLLTDKRSRTAVVVAERFANGEATQDEMAAAVAAARAAARAAEIARRRPAPKVEEAVEYWHYVYQNRYCKTINREVVEDSLYPPAGLLISQCWKPITAAEYEAAKAKAGKVVTTNPCGHGCNKVGIDCDNCADKPVKPAPVGEPHEIDIDKDGLLDWAETLLCNSMPSQGCIIAHWNEAVTSWRDQKHGAKPDEKKPAPATVAGEGAARLLGVDIAPVNVRKIPQVYLRDAYETLEEFLDDMRVKLNETICAVNALKGAGK